MRKKTNSKQKNIAEAAVETAQPAETIDVEATLDELAATPKRQRIWEVDFVRGLMILFVVWDHFMYDVFSMGYASPFNTGLFQWLFKLSGEYYGALRATTHDAFVTMFVFTSGISCSFSRSNGKRALKMCSFAILFSVVTYGLSLLISPNMVIYFNVIHLIALSVLLWTAIEWIWSKLTRNWQKNIFGVVVFAVIMTTLVVGYYANHVNNHWTNVLFGESEWRSAIITKFTTNRGDYLSFMPDFGWFLVGAFLGRVLYREKKTLFPSVNPKFVSPVTFCGRFSLWVYFISQVVMYGFIYLFHVVTNLL